MNGRLLTAAEVAEMLQVTPAWVRAHATDLGAIRLGDGPRARLRFEQERVAAALERRRVAPSAPPKPARRPGRRPQPRDDIEMFQPRGWAA